MPSSAEDSKARIKLLIKQSNAIEVDANIPVRRYFRSGREMIRMAQVYEDEQNYESAFMLYMKFMTLFLEKLPSHPNYSHYNSHSPDEKITTNRMLKDVLPIAEGIKSRLTKRYDEEYQAAIKEQEKLWLEQEAVRKKKQRDENEAIKQNENNELKSYFHSGMDMSDPQYEQKFPVKNDGLDNLLYPMAALSTNPPVSSTEPPPAYHTLQDNHDKQDSLYALDQYPSVPSRTLKPESVSPRTPTVDRSSKPLSLLSAKTGSLRPVIVPQELLSKFMALSDSNTVKNIETCGVLAGKLSQNQLVITDLLVPKQCGTSDSCTTQNEEELFAFQDKCDLITLGWIHTHPTQTAFLSSVDLHTHCSYQLMMPEALAIVCAPKYNEIGYFTLTPHYGLSFIANCHESGFHPHPKEPPLFQTADHFILDQSREIQVLDLRA